MGNKRRKDKNFKIGESMPGTVGDSRGTYHDNAEAPMANINNRRYGELVDFKPGDEKPLKEKHPNHPKKKQNESEEKWNKVPFFLDGPYDTNSENKAALQAAKKYGCYWPEEKRREFLSSWNRLSAEEVGWEDLERKSSKKQKLVETE